MSINLMSAIFRTEFRDLQDNEGNTTKASTAKFVCIALADHANDEGEGAYPSINKIAYKTNLSRSAVINALDALKHNGILTAHGTSKWDTVNYTVKSECFSQDSKPALLVNPIDSPQYPQLTPPVSPVDPNHPLTIIKPSLRTDELKAEYKAMQADPLQALLDMENFPGAKKRVRVDSVLSYLGATLRKNVTSREWREFAEYVDSEHQSKGWEITRFIEWMYGQKNFDLQYWPVKKMRENYPAAFIEKTDVNIEPKFKNGSGYV